MCQIFFFLMRIYSRSFYLYNNYTRHFLFDSTLKPQYNEPWYSEFRHIVTKTQLPFWGFTKHITFSIVNYSKRVWRTCSLYQGLSVILLHIMNTRWICKKCLKYKHFAVKKIISHLSKHSFIIGTNNHNIKISDFSIAISVKKNNLM